jgi:anti-sigma factor RsiW
MHPSRDDLSGFVLGTLDDQVADQVADHIDQCPQCDETLREIDGASDTFIQTLKQPAVEIPHSSESGCRELVQVIQAIGREPSFTSSGGVVVIDKQEEDLGSLGHYRRDRRPVDLGDRARRRHPDHQERFRRSIPNQTRRTHTARQARRPGIRHR